MTTTAPRKPRVVERPKDLASFAREGESIQVRNTTSTIAVLSLKIDGSEEIAEFGPVDSEDGSHVMELSSTYLKNTQFRKALSVGVYEIVDADDPEVIDAFNAQRAASIAQKQKQDAQVNEDMFINSQQPRAFSGTACIEYDGRVPCSEYAIRGNVRERPPLCSKHSHLASTYTPEETGKFVDGKPEINWIKVQILGR